jgi:hypothetical protein
MSSHTSSNDPNRNPQNLTIDLDGDVSDEMEQMVSPSPWETIAPRKFDGPLFAFYISLLLFLLALARAISS